jgi:hypothetical protein
MRVMWKRRRGSADQERSIRLWIRVAAGGGAGECGTVWAWRSHAVPTASFDRAAAELGGEGCRAIEARRGESRVEARSW